MSEVKKALKTMKRGKDIGLNDIPVDFGHSNKNY